MSFGGFRRIYELAPSKWDRYSDYTYRRKELIPKDKDAIQILLDRLCLDNEYLTALKKLKNCVEREDI